LWDCQPHELENRAPVQCAAVSCAGRLSVPYSLHLACRTLTYSGQVSSCCKPPAVAHACTHLSSHLLHCAVLLRPAGLPFSVVNYIQRRIYPYTTLLLLLSLVSLTVLSQCGRLYQKIRDDRYYYIAVSAAHSDMNRVFNWLAVDICMCVVACMASKPASGFIYCLWSLLRYLIGQRLVNYNGGGSNLPSRQTRPSRHGN